MLRSLVASGLVVACLSPLATAQDAILLELYGRGVHAYFAGNSQQAIEYLSSAINAGSRDPRVYYFRGLSMQCQGYSGESDLRYAAELEVADSDEFYGVGRALERIQGRQRLEIERYRTEARLAALQRQQQLRRQRYEDLEQAEPEVTTPIRPRPSLPTPIAPVEPEDEFEMEMPLEEEEPGLLPPAPAEVPDASPFDAPLGEFEMEEPLPADDLPPLDEPADLFEPEMDLPDAPPSPDDFPADDLPPLEDDLFPPGQN